MKYEIILIIRTKLSTGAEKMEMERVQADDLLHLVSQFNMVILQIQRKEHEQELLEVRNDDIPF